MLVGFRWAWSMSPCRYPLNRPYFWGFSRFFQVDVEFVVWLFITMIMNAFPGTLKAVVPLAPSELGVLWYNSSLIERLFFYDLK
jgi:hypothetical protein